MQFISRAESENRRHLPGDISKWQCKRALNERGALISPLPPRLRPASPIDAFLQLARVALGPALRVMRDGWEVPY